MTLVEQGQSSHERLPDSEPLPVGEVRELSLEMVEDDEGRVYARRLVEVGDEHDPFDYEVLRGIGDTWEKEIETHPAWEPLRVGDDGQLVLPWRKSLRNDAALWLYLDDPQQDSMVQWAKLFPTAKALYPLQRLDDGGRVLPGGEIDERAKYLFTNMLDGIGLRARARIMKDLLLARAGATQGNDLTCISIGSGAAVPDIDATVAVREQLGKRIQWNLVDPDADALAFAQELAKEAGLSEDQLKLHNVGYARAYQLERESADFIDVLGLWEYLDDNQTASLLKNSWKLLKPGGTFIASNMLLDRPQAKFNEIAVGWPHLVRRDEGDMVDIATSAGIDPSQLTFTYSTDHVYVVMEVQKPWS